MGPLDASRPWETRDVVGMYRFLQRLWRNMVDEDTGECTVVDTPADDDTRQAAAPHDRRRAHRDGRAAVQHRDRQADRAEQRRHQARRHAARDRRADGADARAARAAHRRGAVAQARPRPTRHLRRRSRSPTRHCLVDDTIEFPVQVNGKVRSRITVAADADAGHASRRRRSPTTRSIAALDGATAEEGHRRPRPDGQRRRLTRSAPGRKVKRGFGPLTLPGNFATLYSDPRGANRGHRSMTPLSGEYGSWSQNRSGRSEPPRGSAACGLISISCVSRR